MKDYENETFSLKDITTFWKLKDLFLRPGELDMLNERMAALATDEQSTNALKEIFLLGFRAGIFFTQDTYEKERLN